MFHFALRLAGVALLVALTVAIHGAGTMLAIEQQMRVPLAVGRHVSRQLVNRAVILLVLELLQAHVIKIFVWSTYLQAIGVFDTFRVALYFTAVTYTTLGYGDVVAGPTWILEAGALAIIGWLMFGWPAGVLVWILGRHYEQIFPRDADHRAPISR
jgi:Ion channel